MELIEIRVPAMGEGITEATINKFLKNIGDEVNEEDTLVEIATDKVDTEIIAPGKGIIEQILFKEGDVVQVGETIMIMNVGSKSMGSNLQKSSAILQEKEIQSIIVSLKDETIINDIKKDNVLFVNKTHSDKFLSPLVRNIADKEGITIEELDKIKGTGLSDRITKDDVLTYALMKKNLSDLPETAEKVKKTVASIENEDIIEMDRMRKLIAVHMIESKKTSAHVTSFVEVDLTSLVTWRNSVKDNFLGKYMEKITYTPIFVEAVAMAIKEFPLINVSVEGTKIILKKQINIGMATALPNGNLIVPVIKNVSELSLLGITKKVNDLAERARTNRLKPDEIQGGTFTITNVGTFGNLTGTPIINQPEVAILAVGAIKKKPAVIETEFGDAIGIRHLMIMSMSYDHRVVDGSLGGMFLKRVADLLEGFDINRDI